MAEMHYGIVAGYDGSPDSDEALRWAAREAQARGTRLTVCLASDPALSDAAAKQDGQALARGLKYAESVVGPGRVYPDLVSGSAARVLVERSQAAEMVVVGSRGHGGLDGLLLGSVPWQVAGHAHGRVVVVRGQWRPVNQSPGPVVVGVDGSPVSPKAIAFAFEEVALRHVDVPLVAVCALADSQDRLGGMHRIEEEFSREITEQEKEHPDITVIRQVAVGSPRSVLLMAAQGAQMIMIGNRGRGGLEGMGLGSVAQALLHHAPCPVGVVHPDLPHPAKEPKGPSRRDRRPVAAGGCQHTIQCRLN